MRARRRRDNEPVAVKSMTLDDAGHRTNAEAEKKVWIFLSLPSNRHQNVLPLVEAFEDKGKNKMHLVMPLAISDMARRTFPEPTAVRYYIQLCRGLDHMHSLKVFHCDIKSENILHFAHGDIAVLSDFGLSSDLNENPREKPRIGTPWVLSPEALRRAMAGYETVVQGDAILADHWSLACVFYQLLTGYRPFEPFNMVQPSSLTGDEAREYKSASTHSDSSRFSDYVARADVGFDKKCTFSLNRLDFIQFR